MAALHFHSLRIQDIRRETPDAVSIAFEIPDDLAPVFGFIPGQNITLKATVGGEEIRRNYSICTSPSEHELRIAVKKIPNGRFSTYANTELKKGDLLDVLPPSGNFHVTLDRESARQYVAFAAGSGITPVISIIKTALETEKRSSFTLVFGNRNRSSILFREDLHNLKDKYPDRFQLIHVLSREKTDTPLQSGRIDAEKCALLGEKLVDFQRIDAFFLCGPEKMIFTVKAFLESAGIDPRKIHFELFATPESAVSSENNPASAQPALTDEKAEVVVKLDGITTRFELAYEGESILNAALRQGIDLPFACKGGVCSTCRARLESGSVHMDVHYALEQDEIEAGFVLTCQSHPRAGLVVVNFDTR
jgi:ring-1,2-phenylacetyl-CoA epoxidase subunit PaaE